MIFLRGDSSGNPRIHETLYLKIFFLNGKNDWGFGFFCYHNFFSRKMMKGEQTVLILKNWPTDRKRESTTFSTASIFAVKKSNGADWLNRLAVVDFPNRYYMLMTLGTAPKVIKRQNPNSS